ncbi:MAG: hypothetical protein JXA49_11145 [Actinobacteria bacterium]|nr:hypothetical protein [Actinomycetota bacterium]
MNCELCGNEVPEGRDFCPNCGLHIGAEQSVSPWDNDAQNSTEPTGRPDESVPAAVQDRYFDDPGGFQSPFENTYTQGPQELPPGTLPPPQQGFAPPGSPPPPGHSYAPPPGTWGAPTVAGSSGMDAGKGRKTAIVLIAVFTIGVLVLGGSVFAYLTFLRPASSLDDASAMLDDYLNAVGSGDAGKVASLHAPDMQPSQEALGYISLYGGMMKFSFGNIELKELSNASDEMEVEITNLKVTIDIGGQKETISLSDFKELPGFPAAASIVKLKKIDGKWLVNEPVLVDPFKLEVESVPTIPSGGSS